MSTRTTLEYRALTTANRPLPDKNEDAVLVDGRVLQGEHSESGFITPAPVALFAVSDGLHESTKPALASIKLLQILSAVAADQPQSPPGRWISRVHDQYSCLGASRSGRIGMAATLVGARITEDEVTVFHVGDSRAWHVRGETVKRLTEDHTVAAGMVSAGEVSAEQALLLGGLSEALDEYFIVDSEGPRPRNSLASVHWQPGDLLVLATDGINMLEDAELTTGDGEALAAFVNRIVRAAVAAGSDDNISVIAIRLSR